MKNQSASRRTTCHVDPQLAGLVGTVPSWRQACVAAEASFTGGNWLVLSGERGTGKTAPTQADLGTSRATIYRKIRAFGIVGVNQPG